MHVPIRSPRRRGAGEGWAGGGSSERGNGTGGGGSSVMHQSYSAGCRASTARGIGNYIPMKRRAVPALTGNRIQPPRRRGRIHWLAVARSSARAAFWWRYALPTTSTRRSGRTGETRTEGPLASTGLVLLKPRDRRLHPFHPFHSARPSRRTHRLPSRAHPPRHLRRRPFRRHPRWERRRLPPQPPRRRPWAFPSASTLAIATSLSPSSSLISRTPWALRPVSRISADAACASGCPSA